MKNTNIKYLNPKQSPISKFKFSKSGSRNLLFAMRSVFGKNKEISCKIARFIYIFSKDEPQPGGSAASNSNQVWDFIIWNLKLFRFSVLEFRILSGATYA